MKLALCGPVEGHIDTLYDHLESLDVHWAVCAGDFGIYPDPARMDRASKKNNYGTDFAKRYVGAVNKIIKTPTLIISGVHDDTRWLAQRQSANNTEILSNVHWLANGYKTLIGWESAIRVTGLGKAYSEATYSGQIGPKSHRHYTRREVERGCSSGPTELLVVYEHLDAPGIRNLVYATRPKLILSVKHPNQKIYQEIQGIPVIQLGRNEYKTVIWEKDRFIL